MTRDEQALKQLLDDSGIRIIKKSQSRLMRFIGFFSKKFMTDFYTTYRLPFGVATIACPDDIDNPYTYKNILMHEVVHCGQFKPCWGPFYVLFMVTLFPLPILFSGRWIIERPAYLRDLREKCMSVDDAVNMLWTGYLWPWPKIWMRKWFQEQLKK